MKELITHTEFLLLEHEYVIIPDLGGFVLNREPARIDHNMGYITAPQLSIGFNADMKFNDGLLAQSFMRQYGIPYDSALHKIEQSVKYLRALLGKHQPVNFGSLGNLSIQDDRLIFEPSSELLTSHPSVWGLTDVRIPLLRDVVPTVSPTGKAKKYNLRKVLIGAGSAAAVALLWLGAGAIETGFFNNMQQSGFFTDSKTVMVARAITDNQVLSSEREVILNEFTEQLKENYIAMPVVKQESVSTLSSAGQSFDKVHYIILGGDTNRNRAQTLQSHFVEKGFRNASIVEAPDRYRIYVASFRDINEANKYLNNFKRKYPAYQDAWVFTKKMKI